MPLKHAICRARWACAAGDVGPGSQSLAATVHRGYVAALDALPRRSAAAFMAFEHWIRAGALNQGAVRSRWSRRHVRSSGRLEPAKELAEIMWQILGFYMCNESDPASWWDMLPKLARRQPSHEQS